jgi:hypothetical protein
MRRLLTACIAALTRHGVDAMEVIGEAHQAEAT